MYMIIPLEYGGPIRISISAANVHPVCEYPSRMSILDALLHDPSRMLISTWDPPDRCPYPERTSRSQMDLMSHMDIPDASDVPDGYPR